MKGANPQLISTFENITLTYLRINGDVYVLKCPLKSLAYCLGPITIVLLWFFDHSMWFNLLLLSQILKGQNNALHTNKKKIVFMPNVTVVASNVVCSFKIVRYLNMDSK